MTGEDGRKAVPTFLGALVQQQRVPIRQTPWLRVVRERLAELWGANTGHVPGIPRADWANELMRACADATGHLSLPCSLREQANHIGIFLVSPSFDGAPVLFLKLYTMLLGEFNSQLKDVGKLMELDCGKPPRSTAVWANCWAKHALSMLVQHHPRYLFADELGVDWALYLQDKGRLVTVVAGSELSPPIIDTEWLCSNSSCADPTTANFKTPPVVVVPPLGEFLQETMSYFRGLIDLALSDPCRIRMFEGEHHHGLQVRLRGGTFTGRWVAAPSR